MSFWCECNYFRSSVKDFAQEDVGVLAPHADADGQNAEGVLPKPALHRWRRDALFALATGGWLRDNDIRVHVPDAGIRVASWNTRGLLGSTASVQDLQAGSTVACSASVMPTTLCVCKKRMEECNPYERYDWSETTCGWTRGSPLTPMRFQGCQLTVTCGVGKLLSSSVGSRLRTSVS